jgi:hypothetical protein
MPTWFDLPYLHGRKDIEPRLRSAEYLGGNRLRVTYEWMVNDTLGTNKYVCFVHAVNPGESAGQQIVFQGDHSLPKPTSQWRPGEVIIDGPHELQISDRFNSYDLVVGLFKGDRVRLQGAEQGGSRILVARLKVEKQGGKTVNVTAEKITAVTPGNTARQEADFKAHTNPPGTWVDFGAIATDGAVKINREKDRLVLFPYPRDKKFRVSLDLAALVPSADPARAEVKAFAAGTQQPIGPVNFTLQNGRLILSLGQPGAGKYVVTWK